MGDMRVARAVVKAARVARVAAEAAEAKVAVMVGGDLVGAAQVASGLEEEAREGSLGVAQMAGLEGLGALEELEMAALTAAG
jgi:hypothetical protein